LNIAFYNAPFRRGGLPEGHPVRALMQKCATVRVHHILMLVSSVPRGVGRKVTRALRPTGGRQTFKLAGAGAIYDKTHRSMRIAVLEDDQAQAEFIGQTLTSQGHACRVFSVGRALIKELRRQTFDLLVLDWNVPDISGEDVLRWVRQSLSRHLPVLFMTSRGSEKDISSMLNAGADDYVVKPVAPLVLCARVNSLLRRAYQITEPSSKEVFDGIAFDVVSKQVFVRGTAVSLMQKEFELALLFFQHISRPLSREYIMDVIWKQGADIPSRTVDTHISSLRTKLGLRPENGYRLSPIYGYGYRLEKTEQNEA
jgi:DNA-binding response OmpR family regulator